PIVRWYAIMAEFECHRRTVGLADVDGLPVANVHGRYPLLIDEHAVRACVVDRDPVTVDVPQHHVRPRYPWLRQSNVRLDVAPDHHIAARPERAVPTTGVHG